MSGIYIRGMEMPTTGTVIAIYKLNGKFYASVHGTELCPLIPVPDHGDLIERDALKKECQENAKRGIGLWVDYMDISLAPTIIPASKEDGE